MSYQECIGSGEKTASAVAYNGQCWIAALEVITDGTNDATVILYDSCEGENGDKIWEVVVSGVDHYGGRSWAMPRRCKNGIYAAVSGTGASFILEYFTEPTR